MMETQQMTGSSPALGQTTAMTSTTGAPGAFIYTLSRFHGEGVRYKAKLIGIEPVPDAQGEKMYRDTMMKLKGLEAVARKQGIHKRRIWLKISSSSLKIVDEKTGAVLHDHESSKISSLIKDEFDPRALAYIYQHQDAYILFYIKTANLAHPVFLDIQEIFQHVDQQIPQEPAQTPTQSQALLILNESSAAEEPGLKDVFSSQLDDSAEQSHQVSFTNELLDVFAPPLEEALTPSQIPCTIQPEPPQQQQALSTSQILSMFPTHPVGGSPYSSPTYLPVTMPMGQQGPPGNQWVAPWPTMPGSTPSWAPPDITVPPAGSQTQAHSAVNLPPGFMIGGNTAGSPVPPAAVNSYPTPLNSFYTPTETTGAPPPVSFPSGNPSLL